MRVLVVFVLAVLNLSFLLWQFYRAQPHPTALAPTDPGVAELMLAGEVRHNADVGTVAEKCRALGPFADASAAGAAFAQLQGFGLHPRMRITGEPSPAYWVIVTADEAARLSPAQLSAAGAGQGGVALTPRPCP